MSATPSATPSATTSATTSAADTLLRLARRARHAEDEATVRFVLVNETYSLVPYQVALLWIEGEGVVS
ncbi:MAG TPA: hypothetical protein VIC30_07335, partial [Orrella sp.]